MLIGYYNVVKQNLTIVFRHNPKSSKKSYILLEFLILHIIVEFEFFALNSEFPENVL